MGKKLQLPIDSGRLESLCEKWQVRQLAVFGSRARNDFTPQSDIDLMVEFRAGAQLGTLDLVTMQDEFEELLGSAVDLVEKGTVRNPYRLASIERDLAVVYSA
jgi:uncharacterized protein